MPTYIGVAASFSGLSIDTIRYYDSLGLLPAADRDGAGRRTFDEQALRWLVFLRRMRATGMPLSQLREYIAHRDKGADGVEGVLTVLRDHRDSMKTARTEIDECLSVIDSKISKYERIACAGGEPGRPEV